MFDFCVVFSYSNKTHNWTGTSDNFCIIQLRFNESWTNPESILKPAINM